MDHITHHGRLASSGYADGKIPSTDTPVTATTATTITGTSPTPPAQMQVQRETVLTIEEDFLPPTARLAEVMEQAEARRQEVLTTILEPAGKQAVASQIDSAPTTPAPRQRRSSSGKKIKSAATTTVPTTTAPDPALDSRSVNIILPTSTYEWFEKQAREADYEPSLAKYLQWQLRKLEKGQRAQERAQEVTEASLAATTSSGEPLPAMD